MVPDEAAEGQADPAGESERDRLERVARALWDDQWRIVENHWADGDVERFAEHNVGIVDRDEEREMDIEERRRLFVDDERYGVRRERVTRDVDVVGVTRESLSDL